MDFRQQTDFQQVDRRYTDLVRQRDAGRISEEDFEAQRQQLTVLDNEGRWWSKSPEGGHWQYHDGSDWIRGTPPSNQETTPEPAAGRTQEQTPAAGRRKRRAWPWVAALVAVVGLAGIGVLAWSLLGQGIPGLGGSDIDAAFVHRATADNISADNTYIDNELINDNPDAILYVTQHWNPDQKDPNEGVYNENPIGVWYDPNEQRWAILNENRAEMPEGAAFNVAVMSEPAE